MKVRHFLIGVLVVLMLGVTFIHYNRIYDVPTTSMQPTIRQGQYVWVGRWYYLFTSPKRWDVVLVELDTPRGKILAMKRVVGLPGETVNITSDGLLINRLLTPPPDQIPHPLPVTIPAEYPCEPISMPRTLGPGEYFLVGDYAANSYDSRFFGPIKLNRIRGKILKVLESLPFVSKHFAGIEDCLKIVRNERVHPSFGKQTRITRRQSLRI